MTEFVYGSYHLSVDVEATREYYQAHPLPWITCDCDGCRNFIRAVKTLPPAVTAFFAALGVDPEKAAEICVDDANRETCLYGSWYHIQGTLLAGGPRPGCLCGEWLSLEAGTEVAFTPECHLVPEDFPQPCFQMNLEWRLPWQLEKENPYAKQRNRC